MVRILIGMLVVLLLLFGGYFWYSQSRLSSLDKKIEANIAKVSEQDATIAAYSKRLDLVEEENMKYSLAMQDIQVQTRKIQNSFARKNVSVVAITNSPQATNDVNQHFDDIFNSLSTIGKPPVVKEKK